MLIVVLCGQNSGLLAHCGGSNAGHNGPLLHAPLLSLSPMIYCQATVSEIYVAKNQKNKKNSEILPPILTGKKEKVYRKLCCKQFYKVFKVADDSCFVQFVSVAPWHYSPFHPVRVVTPMTPSCMSHLALKIVTIWIPCTAARPGWLPTSCN